MLDHLGQGSALVVVTGYGSEEGWIPDFVAKTSTCCKVADLGDRKKNITNSVFKLELQIR